MGEHFAAVIAEFPEIASDALAMIEVEEEPLPVVAGWEAAMRPGSPRVHDGHDNILAHLKYELGSFNKALADAEFVIEERLEMQSLKSMALECRGSAAYWDSATGVLNVWSTSQQYYLVRDSIAQLLKLPYESVQVVARDVGGGFGLKGTLHPEDIVVPVLAYKLRRPLRWAETRSEHMVAAHHSGDQVHDIRVAAMRDGAILGIDVKIYKDSEHTTISRWWCRRTPSTTCRRTTEYRTSAPKLGRLQPTNRQSHLIVARDAWKRRSRWTAFSTWSRAKRVSIRWTFAGATSFQARQCPTGPV